MDVDHLDHFAQSGETQVGVSTFSFQVLGREGRDKGDQFLPDLTDRRECVLPCELVVASLFLSVKLIDRESLFDESCIDRDIIAVRWVGPGSRTSSCCLNESSAGLRPSNSVA